MRATRECTADQLVEAGRLRLAEMLTRRIPSLESVRFTNSGTEATMNAVRLARAFTGRPKLAKFEGAFHGTHDWVMVSVTPDPKTAGNRKRPKPVAWSSGIPPAVLKHTVVLPWNDQEACAEILAREGDQVAGLIVDPLLCNAGLVPPAEGFLRHVGLYVYRAEALQQLSNLRETPLERLERLEQLRALVFGIRIRVVITPYRSRGVDTPGDLAALERDWDLLTGIGTPDPKESPR